MDVFDASPASDNPAVRQLLDENPGSELIICVAGCRGAGVPMVMLKRPSRIASADVSAIAAQIVATASGASQAIPEHEVVCLAGCVGDSGSIVFRGRQHAWIRQEGRETLAAAMADFVARIAQSGHQGRLPARTWVSQHARDGLIAYTISPSADGLLLAAAP